MKREQHQYPNCGAEYPQLEETPPIISHTRTAAIIEDVLKRHLGIEFEERGEA